MTTQEIIEAIERSCPDCIDGIGDVEELTQYRGGEVVAFGHQPKECVRCWPIIENLKKENRNDKKQSDS